MGDQDRFLHWTSRQIGSAHAGLTWLLLLLLQRKAMRGNGVGGCGGAPCDQLSAPRPTAAACGSTQGSPGLTRLELLRNNVDIWKPTWNLHSERATRMAARHLKGSVPFGGDHCEHHPRALHLGFGSGNQPEWRSSEGAAGSGGSLPEATTHEKREESWQVGKGISNLGEEVGGEEELLWLETRWSGAREKKPATHLQVVLLNRHQGVTSQDRSEKSLRSANVEKCMCVMQSSCISTHSLEGKIA